MNVTNSESDFFVVLLFASDFFFFRVPHVSPDLVWPNPLIWAVSPVHAVQQLSSRVSSNGEFPFP